MEGWWEEGACKHEAAQLLNATRGGSSNTCILPTPGAQYARLANCPGELRNDSKSIALLAAGIRLGNNTVYCPGGSPVISCGRQTLPLAELHARGYDKGTIVHATLPSNETVIEWARALLARGRASEGPG